MSMMGRKSDTPVPLEDEVRFSLCVCWGWHVLMILFFVQILMNVSTAVRVVLLGVAAAAVLWQVKPE
jgi:hypothetical protein